MRSVAGNGITGLESHPQTLGGSVFIPLAQNLFGACGVGVLVVSIGYAVGIGAMVLPYALMGAGVVFGAFSCVRAFSDEVRLLLNWYARSRNSDEIRDLRTQLEHYQNGAATEQPQDMYSLVRQVLREYYVQKAPMSFHGGLRLRGYSRQQFDLIHGILVDIGVKSQDGSVIPDTLGVAEAMLDQAQADGKTWIQRTDGRVRAAYISA